MPKRNTVLRRQARKIIYNVVQYMIKEKEEGVKNVNAVQQRAANATGTSERTIRRILAEAKKDSQFVAVFRTPGKKRPRPSPITGSTGIDDFDESVIRRCVHNFHKTEKEIPTVNKLLSVLKRDLDFKGGKTSLKKILKKLGFKWCKTENNRKLLIEKSDIRFKRII